jgi:hypothetical protein
MEGKALKGFDRDGEQAFCSLIEDLGGGPADGGRFGGDALAADAPTFDRAADLIQGRPPATVRERDALTRYREAASA